MTAETTTPPTLQCGWCGSAYRRSYFDRLACCPACGHSLQLGAVTPTVIRFPRHLVAAVVLITAIGFAGFALKSVRRPVLNNNAPLIEAPPPFKPSIEFREATAEKAKLLEQDLALAPNNSFLLASLAETYLYRALAEYQLKGSLAKAQPWLLRSQEYVERLQERNRYPAARIGGVLARFPHLHFNALSWPSITSSLWPLQAGRSTIFASPSPGGIPFIRRRRDVTGLPPVGDFTPGGPPSGLGSPPGMSPSAPPAMPPDALPAGAPPTRAPGVSIFGDRLPQPAPTLPGLPSGTTPLIPQSGPPGLGGPGSPPSRAPELAEPDDEQRLALLRKRFAEQPQDLSTADRLTSELLRLSGVYQPAAAPNSVQSQARQRILEAAEVYERTARIAPLRVQRAAFYASAADARRRLEQWDEQYECLRRTAENVPFAPAVWHDLKTAALRLGKLEESFVADKNERRWKFPGIEPDDRPRP